MPARLIATQLQALTCESELDYESSKLEMPGSVWEKKRIVVWIDFLFPDLSSAPLHMPASTPPTATPAVQKLSEGYP